MSKFFSVTHRLLNCAVVLADVVDDAWDAEGAYKAQQVSQEAECDAEDERSAECFPQGLPDQLWAQWRCALRPLREDRKKEKSARWVKYITEKWTTFRSGPSSAKFSKDLKSLKCKYKSPSIGDCGCSISCCWK